MKGLYFVTKNYVQWISLRNSGIDQDFTPDSAVLHMEIISFNDTAILVSSPAYSLDHALFCSTFEISAEFRPFS